MFFWPFEGTKVNVRTSNNNGTNYVVSEIFQRSDISMDDLNDTLSPIFRFMYTLLCTKHYFWRLDTTCFSSTLQ